jgi:hypothetical protein
MRVLAVKVGCTGQRRYLLSSCQFRPQACKLRECGYNYRLSCKHPLRACSPTHICYTSLGTSKRRAAAVLARSLKRSRTRLSKQGYQGAYAALTVRCDRAAQAPALNCLPARHLAVASCSAVLCWSVVCQQCCQVVRCTVASTTHVRLQQAGPSPPTGCAILCGWWLCCY